MLSVLEKGKPIADQVKLQRLRQIMLDIMGPSGHGTVNIRKVPTQLAATLKHFPTPVFPSSKVMTGMQQQQQQHANHCSASGVWAVRKDEGAHVAGDRMLSG